MKKRDIILLGAVLAANVAIAVPAQRVFRIYTQPDGSQIEAMAVGDEFCRAYIDAEGQYMTLDDDGFIRPTTAETVQQRREASPLLKAIDKGRGKLLKARAAGRSETTADELPQHGMGLFTRASAYPLQGKVRSLVFLVEYQDVKFSTENPLEYFAASLNEEGFARNGATGSARDYFLKQSDGAFDPSFDVFGPVTLSQERAYYGGNNRYGDLHPEEMVTEAADSLASVINFSLYDQDNDGYVDNIYVIYAGEGENSSNVADAVWPHSSAIYDSAEYNGKYLLNYACSNEIFSYGPTGIGPFIHEYSHVLGLPDLYNTANVAPYTPGLFDVMDQGSYNNNANTPPNYSSFERNALRWLRPTLLCDAETITLHPLDVENEACLIATATDTEFFLLENRQLVGNDTYVPHHGMLVWHIDFDQGKWDVNTVNNRRVHQYVDIVEAGNQVSTNFADYRSSYPFPGTSGVTSFTSETKPALVDWAKNPIDMPITNITEHPDGSVSFDVKGGSNGVGCITAVNSSLSITAEGLALNIRASANSQIDIYAPDGTLKASLTTDNNGEAKCTLPSRGIYLVNSRGTTRKIAL